jgi:ethanolamine ammonia-lyase small subunit
MAEQMDKNQLSKIVRQVLTEVLGKPIPPPFHSAQISDAPDKHRVKSANQPGFHAGDRSSKRKLANENIARWLGHEPQKTVVRDSSSRLTPVTSVESAVAAHKVTSPSEDDNLIPNPKRPEKLTASLEHSPARLAVWRAGTRYLTRVALRLRADHAIAKDAVYAELPEGFAEKNGWIPLTTKATNKEEFLLRPDLGRQLDDKSLQVVREKGVKNPDVQITVADGLSSWAAERFAPAMVSELQKLFKEAGMSVGTVFCVKYSRIAIQDVVGVEVGAKVSMILLGERPGLGSGDSLSNYMIYGPKIGEVNAKKSMISNIHTAGHTPADAARLTFTLVKKMFEQGCSGVDLKV